ncbi:MAG: amidohydrolase [Deltaproteobacteria bacterium]|jgi:predicted amidohydrolase YtcJ|nr:amidohydrolase [Deltaproteobacteria bacterium]
MTEVTKVFFNGPILALDEFGQTVEALATCGDMIAAVGSSAAVLSRPGPKTEAIDLKGRTLIPGFIDGHGHFTETGRNYRFKLDLRSPPLGRIRNLTDLVAAVQKKAAETTPGTWIQGFGYDDTLLDEKRHPLAGDLDSATKDHPVAITHISGHFLAVNTRALEIAGLGAGTADPLGGRLRRLEDGRPSGLLEEHAAEDLVRRHIPWLSEDEEIEAVRTASAVWAARGVTTAQDGSTSGKNLAALLAAAKNEGHLSVRVQLFPDYELAGSGQLPVQSGQFLTPRRKLTIGPTKLFSDGSLQGYTGFLANPYHRVMYDLGPTWRGYPAMDIGLLTEKIKLLHLAGRQVAVHANGDAAIGAVIDAFEAALKIKPVSDHRHLIIHCQTVREDQLDRMAALGLKASFFVVHIHYWGDRHHDIFLGSDRAARLNPLSSAINRDITFSLHNDSPITPIDPLRSVQTAVTRMTLAGKILGPEYRIGVTQALRAVTADAAYLAFEEKRKGRLAPGLLADLVVLNQNPLEISPEKIADIKVLATLVGGQVIYGEL